MRSLVWTCLLLAGVATAVLSFVVLRDRPAPRPAETPLAGEAAPAPERPPAAEAVLRPYETTETLTEDLRDALAGPREALAAEFQRVAARLGGKARTVLVTAAPEEASPRVRALLVLAAGSRVPDEEILLAFLADREALVRRAAALAAARAEGGTRRFELLPGIDVPLGRALPEATRRALEGRLSREEDEGVRGALTAALGR